MVKFRAGVSANARSASAAGASAHVLREIPRCWVKDGSTLVVVRSATQTTAELVKAFSADPRVAYAEPDSIVHVDATPNDPRFGELWGMTKIGAPSAWDVSTGSSSVVIADIDTGVDYAHPDLAANMWHNSLDPIDGLDNDGNGYIDDYYGINAITGPAPAPGALTDPMDDDGHGTHTSGIMAAVGNNSIGVAGVCWTARVMALKFIAADDTGWTSNAIACIDYVIDQKVNHNVNVVAMNNSWGGELYEQSLKDAIDAAANAGIVFVAVRRQRRRVGRRPRHRRDAALPRVLRLRQHHRGVRVHQLGRPDRLLQLRRRQRRSGGAGHRHPQHRALLRRRQPLQVVGGHLDGHAARHRRRRPVRREVPDRDHGPAHRAHPAHCRRRSRLSPASASPAAGSTSRRRSAVPRRRTTRSPASPCPPLR